MSRKMTKSEEMVGRHLPPMPKYIDVIMAGHVSDSDADKFCGKMTPLDSWLKPAHRKARSNGWLKFGISFGKGAEIWFLTERGEPEAIAAKARVDAAYLARSQWARECASAWRAA